LIWSSTGAPLQLAATRAVGFKVGATFKQEVADSVTATTPTKAVAKKNPGQGHHVEDHGSEEDREEVAAHAKVTRLCVADRSPSDTAADALAA